jgi:predicted amidohydrolase
MVQMPSIVGNAERNIDVISQFVAEAASKDVDIVCFPELGINGYNAGDTSSPDPESIPGPSTDRLCEIAASAGITFLAGLLERDEDGIVYNAQIVFGPGGIEGVYRKTHVPTAEIGTWCHSGHLPVFNHPKVRFGIEICYDSHFPEVSTALASKGAEIIFCHMLLAERRRTRSTSDGCGMCRRVRTTTEYSWPSATR